MSPISRVAAGAWPITPLGDVCWVVTGSTPPRGESRYFGGSVPWIKPEDLDTSLYVVGSKEYLTDDGARLARRVPKGSVLVSCIGKIGKVAIAGVDLAVNQQINCLVPGPRVVSEYLYYAMRFEQGNLRDRASNTIVPILNKSRFAAVGIPLPPLADQKRIVAKLDEQMAALDRAEKALAEQQATASILATAVLQHALNETESPHWPQVRLGDMMESDLQQVSPDDDSAAGLPYVGMEDIESQTGRIIAQSTQCAIRSNTFAFDEHHVLYGKLRPYLNKVALPESRGRCSTELIPLLPKAGTDRRYLAWLLRRPETVSAAMQEKTGSRMPRASMQSVMRLHVPLPPLSQQKQIARSLDQAHANLVVFSERVADQEASLVALRITLLDAAFSGEI